MVDFIADTLWPSVALTVVVLSLLGLGLVLRPTLRRNRRFRAVLRAAGVVVAIQLILIPIYILALVVGDWPPMDTF